MASASSPSSTGFALAWRRTHSASTPWTAGTPHASLTLRLRAPDARARWNRLACTRASGCVRITPVAMDGFVVVRWTRTALKLHAPGVAASVTSGPAAPAHWRRPSRGTTSPADWGTECQDFIQRRRPSSPTWPARPSCSRASEATFDDMRCAHFARCHARCLEHLAFEGLGLRSPTGHL
jgi:hypothetical protein